MKMETMLGRNHIDYIEHEGLQTPLFTKGACLGGLPPRPAAPCSMGGATP